VFSGAEQVGFARVVTDRATFAYLADVFVLETHRGCGVGKWLMETILTHPELQGLRRWMLVTRDAHELYGRHGFDRLKRPEIFMERKDALYALSETATSPACAAAGSPNSRPRTSRRPRKGYVR
jgi:GNAT superfamily N-acetyltransferase